MIHPQRSNALKEFFRKEKITPDVSRAILISVALTVPIAIGHYFNYAELAIIPAITAQFMTSARIPGTFGEKCVILLVAILALSVTAFIGTLAGTYIWTAVLFLGIIAGLASLARGIGDYGQGFGISGVILFLISLYPPHTLTSAFIHAGLVLAGGIWAMLLIIYRWPLMPERPFYMDIARPWHLSTSLMKSLTEPAFDYKKSAMYINKTEGELRKALNDVLPWLKKKRKGTGEIRRESMKIARAASRFGATALTLHGELSNLAVESIPLAIYLKIKKTADVLGEAANAVTNSIVSRNKKNYLKTKAAIRKAHDTLDTLIKTVETGSPETEVWIKLLHIVSLFESALHYLDDALQMLDRMEKAPQGKSIKNTIDLKYRLRRIYKAFIFQIQPNSLIFKHSMRVMLTTSVGISIYYIFEVPRGYWIVLTIMVLLQPDFATTWEKARDRILGTILGVILGTLLIISSFSFNFTFLIVSLATCSFLFAYYQAKNYKISVIFVTIMLVSMLDLTQHIDWHVAAYRLLSTIIGAVLSIIAAYLLWPTWESLRFGVRLSKAIEANKNYLTQIGFELHKSSGFHQRVIADRRKAEVENLNMDEALKRLKFEPSKLGKKLQTIRNIVELNKKLTRELTSFAAYLPKLKEDLHFREADLVIKSCTEVLESLSQSIKNKKTGELPRKLDLYLEEMESKCIVVKTSNFSNPDSFTVTLETSLLPYEVISTKLKKIVGYVKQMVEPVNELKDDQI